MPKHRHPNPAVFVEKLEPAPGQTWLSLMPPDADDYTRLLFLHLHEGIVEAWTSETGTFHLVLATDKSPTPGPAQVTVSGAPSNPRPRGIATKSQRLD